MKGLTPTEKKGVIWAAVWLIVGLILAGLTVLPPDAPLQGTEGSYQDRIVQSPFMEDALVPIIAILFLIPGLVYGIVNRNIRNDKDVAAQMSDTMASMGDRKSTRLNSSHVSISYAVFCFKKKYIN